MSPVLRLEAGVQMFRMWNYPGASGEEEGGGFTFFKEIFIPIFIAILLVQFSAISRCG